jgi:hypothetical protein
VKHRTTDKEGNHPVKTMPRPVLWAMRATVEGVLTAVTWWEDKYTDADRPDYRMTEMSTGLWQASQSMKAIQERDFQPMSRQARLRDLPEVAVLGDAYHRELLREAPVPLRSVD